MCCVNQSLITSAVLQRFELCEGSHTPVGTNSSNEFRARDIDIFYKEPKPWREEFLGYNPTKHRFFFFFQALNTYVTYQLEKRFSVFSKLRIQCQAIIAFVLQMLTAKLYMKFSYQSKIISEL